MTLVFLESIQILWIFFFFVNDYHLHRHCLMLRSYKASDYKLIILVHVIDGCNELENHA